MAMISPELLALAQQGNPKAISQLLDRALAAKQITTKVTRDQHGLTIFADAPALPDQASLVGLIHRGIKDLKLDKLYSLKIYGRQVGDASVGWREEVLLSPLPVPKSSKSGVRDSQFEFKLVLAKVNQILAVIVRAVRRIRIGRRTIAGVCGVVLLALLTCGGVVGFNLYQTRAAQAQTIQKARSLVVASDPGKASGIEVLKTAEQQLQQARDLLRGIPNSPGSLYREAQAELAKVRSQLDTIEQRVALEETTTRDWEAAVQLGQDAIASVRQPPLPLKDWKAAKANLDKAITQLSAIPSGTFAASQVKAKLDDYRKQSLVITQKLAAEQKAVNSLQAAVALAKQAMAMTENKYSVELADLQNAQTLWQKAISQLKTVPSQSYAARSVDIQMGVYTANVQKIARGMQELRACQKDSSLSFGCDSVSLRLEQPAASSSTDAIENSTLDTALSTN